jgi:hypothetical protein
MKQHPTPHYVPQNPAAMRVNVEPSGVQVVSEVIHKVGNRRQVLLYHKAI